MELILSILLRLNNTGFFMIVYSEELILFLKP